ncbi:hypothetical protein QFC22_004239 [Naganishia vaughanmartiniae]|uniref:Uncharacterized protein n=1 Tax=Naganishia vaughanmartiniae TaxID=1424756 RepID=A0ACC2X3T6_9TREE|nr:hypothetical protein QFC22_004239 [Naganishia vaughanmartiniae]
MGAPIAHLQSNAVPRETSSPIISMPSWMHSKKDASPAAAGSAVKPGKRNPPNLDRQRALASAVGNPRKFWEEAVAAKYDLETIKMCAQPVNHDIGTSMMMSMHGGAWTKEETVLQKAIEQSRSDLDAAIGTAKECLDNGETRGHAGLDDQIRNTALNWRNLMDAWRVYSHGKDKAWGKRVAEQVGDLAGKVLGVI